MSLAAHSAPQDGFASLLEHHLNKDLLRFTTAGSVDDGKSTLIGRLLYDSKAVYEDQLASVKKSRVNRSGGPIDFSLLTDGLRAERAVEAHTAAGELVKVGCQPHGRAVHTEAIPTLLVREEYDYVRFAGGSRGGVRGRCSSQSRRSRRIAEELSAI